jgi:hypothetical protein
MPPAAEHADETAEQPGLLAIAREPGRIGCIGFGSPPAHIALLRQLCVRRASSKTRSPPATSSPAPPRRSSRSSAPGDCAAARERSSAAPASSRIGGRPIMAVGLTLDALAFAWMAYVAGPDGDTIHGRWETSPDGRAWELAFELTYCRRAAP